MNDMKKLLAIIIVATWSVSILLVLILIIFNMLDASKGQEILKTFGSVSAGFVGLIIGHYFTGGGSNPPNK